MYLNSDYQKHQHHYKKDNQTSVNTFFGPSKCLNVWHRMKKPRCNGAYLTTTPISKFNCLKHYNYHVNSKKKIRKSIEMSNTIIIAHVWHTNYSCNFDNNKAKGPNCPLTANLHLLYKNSISSFGDHRLMLAPHNKRELHAIVLTTWEVNE